MINLTNLPAPMQGIIGKASLFAKRNWPTIATVGGCVGVVGGTVLACRATLELPDILETHKAEMCLIENTENSDNKPEDFNAGKSKAKAYANTALSLAKAYGPSACVIGSSVGLIASSHIEMGRREAALSAAYSTMATSFDSYRDRVKKLIGEDKELKAYFGGEEETVEREEINPETGRKRKVKEKQVVIDVDPSDFSRYARAFCKWELTPKGDVNMGSTEWLNDSSQNLFFLRTQQSYANDMLHSRGWVSLNEVYDMLGFDRIPEGQVVGWVDNEDHTKVIDFGIYNMGVRTNQLAVNQPDGFAPAIMLDFNIDPKSLYDQDLFFRL